MECVRLENGLGVYCCIQAEVMHRVHFVVCMCLCGAVGGVMLEVLCTCSADLCIAQPNVLASRQTHVAVGHQST